MKRTLSLVSIAMAALAVNSAYCQAINDPPPPAWDDLSDVQRDGYVRAVRMHLDVPDMSPRVAHEAWLASRQGEGWVWGPTKNAELKQHPCMLPYDQLPKEQQVKDHLFRAVVHALANVWDDEPDVVDETVPGDDDGGLAALAEAEAKALAATNDAEAKAALAAGDVKATQTKPKAPATKRAPKVKA